MACVHEFGIVEDISALPEDIGYEPERYGCIRVDDDAPYIDDWWPRLELIPTYWENLHRPEHGLARWGITLIPPESLPAFGEIVESDPRIKTDQQLAELSWILREAIRRDKYVIHFGV